MPVSYTHLDVYKRQAEIWATTPTSTAITMTMSPAKLVKPAVTTAAVSIAAIDMERTRTQDVYKRQESNLSTSYTDYL